MESNSSNLGQADESTLLPKEEKQNQSAVDNSVISSFDAESNLGLTSQIKQRERSDSSDSGPKFVQGTPKKLKSSPIEENTILSFITAATFGAEFVEFDVQVSFFFLSMLQKYILDEYFI